MATYESILPYVNDYFKITNIQRVSSNKKIIIKKRAASVNAISSGNISLK